MRSRSRSLVFLLLLAIVSPGCGSWWADVAGPTAEDLDRSLSAFRKQILFARYANAKTLVLPGKTSAFTRFTFEVEDRLKVTEFKAQDVEIVKLDEKDARGLDDAREARVLVRIDYTMRPDMELKKALVETVWVPISEGWMLDFPEEGWKL